MKSFALFLSTVLLASTAYAESLDRSAPGMARNAITTATEGRAAPSPSGSGLVGRPAVSSERPASAPSVIRSLNNGGGKSVNPIGAEQKFKNDLKDSLMRNTTEGAKMDAKEASSGIGIGQKEGVANNDQGTIDELKHIKEKNDDIESRKNYCTPRCKKISKGEDAGPSGPPTSGVSGLPSQKLPSLKIKTEEEKAAEAAAAEQAKKEKEAYDALSQKEKFDICMKDCMKSAGASWSSMVSKLKDK